MSELLIVCKHADAFVCYIKWKNVRGAKVVDVDGSNGRLQTMCLHMEEDLFARGGRIVEIGPVPRARMAEIERALQSAIVKRKRIVDLREPADRQ